MKKFIQGLTAFRHRGSTTENERKAAEFIHRSLIESGLNPEISTFKSPATYSWEIILISLFLTGGLALSAFYPVSGAISTTIGFLFFLRYFTLRPSPLSWIIPRHKSQNIYARIKAAKEAKQHIILMAHYDSAKASALYSPKMVKSFRSNFKINTGLAVVAVPWCFLGTLWHHYGWYLLISALLAINFFSNIVIHIHRELFHRFTQGANDNASGCAVIYALGKEFIRQPLQNIDLHLLFTGCEEVGAYGAKKFLSDIPDDLSPENTLVINFDNVGSGILHYAVGEGMLLYYPYEPSLTKAMEEICQEEKDIALPLEYRLAYFDTLPFVHNNYPCLTFISLNQDKSIPNWHWYSDTIENISFDNLEHAFRTGKRLINKLAEESVIG